MDNSFGYQNLMLQLPVFKYFKTTGLQPSKALGLFPWALGLLGTRALGLLGS
jgi:hypothetical protein